MSETILYNCDIPPGWAIIDFNKACDKISLNEIKIKQKEYLAEGKYPVVDQGQELIGGYFDEEEFVIPLNPPYIVFGDHTKVKKYINFKFIAGADGIKVLKSKEFYNPKILFYFLHVIKIPDKGYARHFQFLEKSEIPLPPSHEQHRIVAKIEELFSELDKGVESLKTAQQQLKVYRQAVLKWAFEGKLTNKNAMEGELPDGWKWVKISDISNVVRGGSPRPAGDKRYYDGNIPFLKVADITRDNNVFLNTFNYTIKEAGLHKTRKISPKTLLLSNSGATLGVPKICMIDATMNDGIAAFLNLDERSNLYLYYFWLSKTRELRNINMGAAQPNLNTDIIKNYVLPYCSFEQQKAVVTEIESRLSVADKLEETISQSLQQAEALRQSILKKAFEGKLVPQDPNDEPASKLLECIKAERTAPAPSQKTRKKKAIQ